MKIRPVGFYVLVEMEEVEKISKGGIVLPDDLINKEQDAADVGHVRDIGPTAFAGYPGCEDRPDIVDFKPHMAWGVKIGDKVEYRKFEGKRSIVKGFENYRYLPDSHIIGVIIDG